MTGHCRENSGPIRRTDEGIEIFVRVQPKARRPRIMGIHDGCLKIAVGAPPENGKANQAIVQLLAETLDVAASRIEIVRGASSRSKRLRVSGITLQEAGSRLLS